MKLSVFSNLYRDKRLEELLSKLRELGISSLELSAGGYFGNELCSPAELLKDKTAFYKFRETFNTYDIDICALSVHGNPVHPNKETASGFDADFKNAVLLAEMLEIDTVVTFSGCPGDSQGSCCRRISGSFLIGSGTRSFYLIGMIRQNLQMSMVSRKSLSICIRDSRYIIPKRHLSFVRR